MTAVEHNLPVIWVIFDDAEFKLIKIYQLATYLDTGLVEFQNPDYAAYARACGADGYTVETLEEFEAAFDEALASGRPIDHRRSHHPLGDPPLQHLAGRNHRGYRRDGRGEAAVLIASSRSRRRKRA